MKGVVLSYEKNAGATTPVVSLRPKLVSSAKDAIPTNINTLFKNQKLCGYVCNLDERYGAFVRFGDGLTGIVPKLKGGLEVGERAKDEKKYTSHYETNIYSQFFGSAQLELLKTVDVEVSGVDVKKKSLLLKVWKEKKSKGDKGDKGKEEKKLEIGEECGRCEVVDVKFERINVKLLDCRYSGGKARTRIHYSLFAAPDELGSEAASDAKSKSKSKSKSKAKENANVTTITPTHPFYNVKIGQILHNVHVAGKEVTDDVTYFDLATTTYKDNQPAPMEHDDLKLGDTMTGVVSSIVDNAGVWLQLAPGMKGFVPGLELSEDVGVLNDLKRSFEIGERMGVVVTRAGNGKIDLSKLLFEKNSKKIGQVGDKLSEKDLRERRPEANQSVVCSVNRKLTELNSPALMVEMRAGFFGRCCITELAEESDWENLPLGMGKIVRFFGGNDTSASPAEGGGGGGEEGEVDYGKLFVSGSYVKAIVKSVEDGRIELTLRRGWGDNNKMDEEEEEEEEKELPLPLPEVGDIVKAYVTDTNKKGCFLRLNNGVNGRVILKDLSDKFVADPKAEFPVGRLVAGKVKAIKKGKVELNMRESALFGDEDKLGYDDIDVDDKLPGVVTRIESFGVFVKFDHSDISGLCHVSQLSDDFVREIGALYSPGDRVKALVMKKDMDGEKMKISLGLKASYFAEDSDSDSSSVATDGSDSDSDSDSDSNSDEDDIEMDDSAQSESER